jgi:RNA polymerase sigma factor (sigma-70 family)
MIVDEKTPVGTLDLWQSHIGLAKDMARKYSRIWKPILGDCVEDLEQAAMMGLWIAAHRFDPTKGTEFSTYAWDYIKGELNCERWRLGFWGFAGGKAQAYKQFVLPDRDPLSSVPEKVETREDFGIDQFENVDLLHFLIRQLRPIKAQVVARRFWLEGLSTATIAHQMALSTDRIDQIRAKAKKDLIALAGAMGRIWER